MATSKTQVEGSLNAVIDESSDEEEEEVIVVKAALPTAVAPSACADEEEEEREVFSEETHAAEEAKPQRRKSALIDAMQMSVKDIETVKAPKVEESPPDMFGISYKPYGKPKTEYSMPSGPAFEDEAEFEKELTTAASAPPPDNDDDFDFEPTSNSALEIVQKLQEALREEEPQIIESNETIIEEVASAPSPDKEEKINIFAASQAAFEDIAEVYRTGLGDHEVAIMQSTVALQDIVIETGAIAEVDEEALAAQEEAEERAAIEAVEAEKRERENLEKQWESVGVGASESSGASVTLSNKCISYKQAEEYFRSLDLSVHRGNIVTTEEESSGFLKSIFSKREKLSFENSDTELELPFLIAQVPYAPEEEDVHAQIMRSTFEFFTGISGVPLLGGHWENIGFQGNDPKTDINRSMKMLAALQVLHFADTQPELAKRVFHLSTAQSNSGVDITWPFMCVAIMFTKHAIDELRLGHVNKECNKKKSVISVLHEIHHGCFVLFEKCLLSNEAVHHAVHLASVKKNVNANVAEVIALYRREVESLKTGAKKSTNAKPPNTKVAKTIVEDDRFDNIGDMVEGSGTDAGEADQARARGKKFLAPDA